MAQVVEHLPSKCKALNSGDPVSQKKKERKRKKKRTHKDLKGIARKQINLVSLLYELYLCFHSY
jgi:hypothetical protein